jgi:hypothetical protein
VLLGPNLGLLDLSLLILFFSVLNPKGGNQVPTDRAAGSA